jgi:hypothetical protein
MFGMCPGVYNMRAYTELIGIGPKKQCFDIDTTDVSIAGLFYRW